MAGCRNIFLFIVVWNYSYAQGDTMQTCYFREGYTVIYGIDRPSKGYCDSCKVEEGMYIKDRKEGLWTKYHEDGETPRLIGEYKNGRPNGEYWKYYPSGVLRSHGFYEGLKFTKTYTLYFESGCVNIQKSFDKDGREHGPVEYYNDDCDTNVSRHGTLQFDIVKEHGVSIDPDHPQVICREQKEPVFPDLGLDREENSNTDGPDGFQGTRKDGKRFDPNGFNKLYNDNDELWLEGLFREGVLWDGKYYKYDPDGILLKIEIWKKGKYHSDGQL